MKSTLLIPTLNEIEALRVVMPKLSKSPVDEILIIDGGSIDGTVEYLESLGYEVLSQKNIGFGGALLEGLNRAAGEIIVEFTSDGSSIPEVIPLLVSKIKKGKDLVIASRYLDGAISYDDDFVTAFGNKLFTSIVNKVFKGNYTDVLVGFRAYRKSIAMKLNLDTPGLGWTTQSSIRFLKNGYKVTEIPADEPKRIGGVRKMKPIKTGLEILQLILKEYFI